MAEVRKVGGGGSLKFKSKSAQPAKATVAKPEALKTASVIIPKQKTAAERAFEASQRLKLAEVLPVLARKSHKEKVSEYNDYLGKLSEHHDIPKVGPG
jgi:protein FAM32A